MQILRTTKEYQKEQEAFEKVKKQTVQCPGCYTNKKHSFVNDVKGIEAFWRGNHFYCSCHRCGTIWETDYLE